MKRIAKAIILVLILSVCLAACEGQNIWKTSEDPLAVAFDGFNGDASETVWLEDGDLIKVVINKTSGNLGLYIETEGFPAIFEHPDVITGNTYVEVPRTGEYRVTLHGTDAVEDAALIVINRDWEII